MNILIVEDNAEFRESLRQRLAQRFPALRISEAADGREAMRHVRQARFCIVLMDLRLPNGNGLDLTRRIKALSARTRVCVVTSHSAIEYRDAAFRNGADHFLVKGEMTENEIAELVEPCLRGHSA